MSAVTKVCMIMIVAAVIAFMMTIIQKYERDFKPIDQLTIAEKKALMLEAMVGDFNSPIEFRNIAQEAYLEACRLENESK